jgi:Transmembrane domain of unknown function (DUF3566)
MAQSVDEPTPSGTQSSPSSAMTAAGAIATPSAPAMQPGSAAAAAPRERAKPPQRRTRVTVRRVGPLSVLKFSLIFYFCVMVAVFLGLVFLFMIMQAVGVIDTIEEWVTKIFPQNGGASFQIEPGYLMPRAFLIGCAMVVVWSLINVMVAFLYNLISDVVGGVEITLAEKK